MIFKTTNKHPEIINATYNTIFRFGQKSNDSCVFTKPNTCIFNYKKYKYDERKYEKDTYYETHINCEYIHDSNSQK